MQIRDAFMFDDGSFLFNQYHASGTLLVCVYKVTILEALRKRCFASNVSNGESV